MADLPGCPHPGVIPADPEACLAREEPHHRDVRFGGLALCFRETPQGAWVCLGVTTAEPGYRITPALLATALRHGRALAESGRAGPGGREVTPRCPDCGALFGGAPEGTPPFRWECGDPHLVESSDGTVTQFSPGEAPLTVVREHRAVVPTP